MTLDSNQFFNWCVGVIVLVFAAGMIFVAVCAVVLTQLPALGKLTICLWRDCFAAYESHLPLARRVSARV